MGNVKSKIFDLILIPFIRAKMTKNTHAKKLVSPKPLNCKILGPNKTINTIKKEQGITIKLLNEILITAVYFAHSWSLL